MSNKIKKTWNLIYKMWDEVIISQNKEYEYIFKVSNTNIMQHIKIW